VETNALEWALLIANATAEYDLSDRCSAALSLHYSALDYFSSNCKFRTFIFRPEVRYWFRPGHRGLFFDVHLQSASYNFALPSWKYRIQDVDGTHPALGGGLGVGYRIPLEHSARWCFQAQAGVGMYHLRYHRWDNRRGGQIVDIRSRTFFGVDNVSLSLVYHFKTSRQ